MSLAGTRDDAPTGIKETVDLVLATPPNEERIDAADMTSVTATAQERTSATPITQEKVLATGTSSSYLGQIVVTGKTESKDTSWVEKLPTLVFSAAWILPCDKR
jgi:hypothetical protein